MLYCVLDRESRRCPLFTMALALFLSGSAFRVSAFTDEEAREIFDILDGDHAGKVTNVDFQMNKINALFSRHRAGNGREIRLTFEETGLSREFFDQADRGHNGYLDATDITYALRVEDINTTRRGYFDYAELAAYLNTIGRQVLNAERKGKT
jgi:Ca2+-binding EF-hand superfamily protein